MNQQMMRKLQQLKKEMVETQNEILKTEFKTTCGAVTIVMLGSKEIKQVIFSEDYEVKEKDDLEVLSDMVVAGCRQLIKEIDEYTAEKMQKYASFLGM